MVGIPKRKWMCVRERERDRERREGRGGGARKGRLHGLWLIHQLFS